MENFMKKHPALEDSLDTILNLLAGSFALVAILIVWVKEVIAKRKDK